MPDSKPAARKVLPSDPAVVAEYLEYHAPHKFPGKEHTDDHASADEVQFHYKTGPKSAPQNSPKDFAPPQKPDPMLRNLNKSSPSYGDRAFEAHAMKDLRGIHDVFFGSATKSGVEKKKPAIAAVEQSLGSKVRDYESKHPQKRPTTEPREHEEASKGPEQAAAMDRRIGRRQHGRAKPNPERMAEDTDRVLSGSPIGKQPKESKPKAPAAAPKKDYFNKALGGIHKVLPALAALPALAGGAGGAAAGGAAAGGAAAGGAGAMGGMGAARTAMNAASMMPKPPSQGSDQQAAAMPKTPPADTANLGRIPPTAATVQPKTKPVAPPAPQSPAPIPTPGVKAFKADEDKASPANTSDAGDYKDPSSYNRDSSERTSHVKSTLTSSGMNAPIGSVTKDYAKMAEGRCSGCGNVARKCGC